MRTLYTWAGTQPSQRNLTIADLKIGKGKKKFTQVTTNTADEAAAAAAAGVDMMICNSRNISTVREGNDNLFLTAAVSLPHFPTADDVLREAFRAMELGADAVMTQRSLEIITMLAWEDIPVMGHLGLVPRKSTWVGGLRAVGKTADEAFRLYERFRQLEDAGACLVEAEVIPGRVMAEISARSRLITVSLGSGRDADVVYLFMEDICGEKETSPRHARAFGNLARLHEQIRKERVTAVTAFREAAKAGNFPCEAETAKIDDDEFMEFLDRLDASY